MNCPHSRYWFFCITNATYIKNGMLSRQLIIKIHSKKLLLLLLLFLSFFFFKKKKLLKRCFFSNKSIDSFWLKALLIHKAQKPDEYIFNSHWLDVTFLISIIFHSVRCKTFIDVAMNVLHCVIQAFVLWKLLAGDV